MQIQIKRINKTSSMVTTPSKVLILVELKNGEYVFKINTINCQKMKRSAFSMNVDSDLNITFNASAVERSPRSLKADLDTAIKISSEVKECIKLIMKELVK